MNFQEWLQYGIDNSYVGPLVCLTHDGYPTTEAEYEQERDGKDVCLFVMRYYESPQHRKAVEGNHAPSAWRLR